MSYIQYPLQNDVLLRKKKKIRRELLQNGVITKRIAILGGSTTNEIADQLINMLLDNGINAIIYQSEYGKYWEDAVFGNEKLNSFNPDIIYIHTNWRNIDEFPIIEDSEDEVNNKLNRQFIKFEEMWQKLSEKFNCIIIQNNFDKINYRILGNRDVWDYRGKLNFISRLNQMFYKFSQDHKNFYINDIDYLSSDYGLSKWNSTTQWNLYKYAMSIDAIPYLSFNLANIIKSLYGKNKKALSLDLDNTLWGGVIGDDGQEGILIGQELPEGQVFFEFQKYCKELQSIGVILTINSKNEYENAILGLNHPDGLLKPKDFIIIKSNWNQKNVNLIETANEIGIGVDSFVFFDDNPVEREIVEKQLPMVGVPKPNKPEEYIEYLDHSGFFETTILSNEDIKKSELYRTNMERKKLESKFENYDDFLKSLNMEAIIKPFDSLSIQRISQLTNKSNQFNLTTLRCSESDIKNMSLSENYITLYGRLKDKFGDNGIITLVSGKINESNLILELWLMSCRVLKRGMEDLVMNYIVDLCKHKKIKTITGIYKPTQKNKMVKNFYGEMGFTKSNEDENQTIWKLDVDKYIYRNTAINLEKGE